MKKIFITFLIFIVNIVVKEFRVNLITLDILDKAFKNNKYTKIAIDVIKTNRLELLRYWEKVVLKGESVKFKMYVPYK